MSVDTAIWALRHSGVKNAPDLLVLIELAYHADDRGANSWPSVERLCKRTGLGRRRVFYALKNLKRDGRIEATGFGPSGSVRYRIVLDGQGVHEVHTKKTALRVQDVHTKEGVHQMHTKALRVHDVHGGAPHAPELSSCSSEVGLSSSNGAVTQRSSSSKRQNSTAAVERRIFEYAADRLGHPTWKLTDDRRAKIRARLREGYSEADLRLVIDGVLLDPWEGRVQHCDPKQIFRDGSHVDKFIELANGSSNGHGDPEALRQARRAAEMREVYARQRAAEEGRTDASPQ